MAFILLHAQAPQEHAASMEKEHEHEMQSSPTSLSEQIGDLSRQVSELQIKVREQGVDSAAMKANGDERRLKMSMGTMGGVSQAPLPQPMSAGPSNQMPAANMMAGMMSMMSSMMSGMGGMPGSVQWVRLLVLGVKRSYPLFQVFLVPHISIILGPLISSSTILIISPPFSLEQQSRLSEFRMSALMKRSEFKSKNSGRGGATLASHSRRSAKFKSCGGKNSRS